MRVFMTGGSGYIGSAVAAKLRQAGHDVATLARATAATSQLRDLGVAIVAGDLASLPSLGDTLAGYDVFVHIAQSNGPDAASLGGMAIDTFLGQRGREAALVYTSGVWVLGNTGDQVADESTTPNPLALVAWRPAHEERVLAAGDEQFRTCVVRPGCVYGGKQSLFAGWFAAAEQGADVNIVGDGNNRWTLVDLHDLADCYVRAVEQSASGILHAVDDSNETLNELAKLVIRSAGDSDSTIAHVPLEAARAKFGPFADALVVDQRASSQKTRTQLGWTPARTFASSIAEQWKEWRALKG